jgi:rhamnose transport system substrate-binding protein
MKKVLALSLVLTLLGSAAVFAGGKKDATTGRHAFVFKSAGNPFGEALMAGFEAGIKEQGGTAITNAPALPTAEGQIAIIEQLIAQKVDSICISGNDADALQPVLTKAKNAGIKVLSTDSPVNATSRALFVNQAISESIGVTLVEAAYDLAGGSGEFAILSATSQAPNQNIWIDYMKTELAKSKYSNLKLVEVAYGDDLRDKSVSETEGLLLKYPNLKVIVAPTTVGIAAAAKVITDKNLIGKVQITGLGLPSEMAEYIDNKSCPYMFLWNLIDMGYLASYAATALTSGKITGALGQTFSAGKLGNYTIVTSADGGTEVILGPPFKFEPSNINEFKNRY